MDQQNLISTDELPAPTTISVGASEDTNIPPETITVGEANPRPNLSESKAADRAKRAQIAFPNAGMTFHDIFNSIVSGQEKYIRDALSGIKDQEINIQNQTFLQEYAKDKGRPLTLPESLLIQDILNKKRANPDTVIEEGYAEAFIDNLRKRAKDNPDSELAQAFNQIPRQVENDLKIANTYKAKKEILYGLLQEAQTVLENQSFAGKAVDFLKMGIPGYQMAKQYGLIPNVPFDLKMGKYLDQQAATAYSIPLDQFSERITPVARHLMETNPQLAVSWLSSMLGQEQEDRVVNNLLPIQDALIGADLARGGYSSLQYLRMARQVRKGIKEYVKAIDTPTGEIPLANAAGDTVEAGVKETIQDMQNSVDRKINSTDATLKPLASAFNASVSSILNDESQFARSLGREFLNRISERNTAVYSDFIDRVIHSMQVDRIPAVMAIEKNVRAMVKEVIDKFPELDNSIMDVRFRKDGVGNLLADVYITRDGINTFSSAEHGMSFARTHKIGNVTTEELQGPTQPKIIPGARTFRTSQGSEYVIHSDGTTTRRAAEFRPGDTTKQTATRVVEEWRPFTDSVPAGSKIRVDVTTGEKQFLYREESQVEVLSKTAQVGPDGKPYTKVKTARGEEYVPSHEIRNIKTETVRGPSPSARGRQPKSERTIFVDNETARKLALSPRGKEWRIVEHSDGTFSLLTKNAAGNYTGAPGQTYLRVDNVPTKGTTPIELWGGEKISSTTSYSRRHVGNPITEVNETPGSTILKPQGLGYVLVKTIPWNETNSVTRDFLLTTNATHTPQDMVNAFGGWFGAIRTPEETLAYENLLARKVAVYGINILRDLVRASNAEIKELKGWGIPGTSKWKAYQEFKRVMNVTRKIPDSITGEKGMPQFNSPGQLAEIYQNTVQRLPSEREVSAAFAYKRQMEMMQGFRRIQALRRLQRIGAMQWNIRGPLLDLPASMSFTKNFTVHATRVHELPGSDTILVMGKTPASDRVLDLAKNFKNSRIGKVVAKNIEEGKGFLLELADPDTFPMFRYGSVGDQWVRYIYTDFADSSLIDLTKIRLPRLADTDYAHYVVQPIIDLDRITNSYRYLGDKTIAGFNTNSEAKDVAERLNAIRKLISEDKIEEAKALHQRSTLPQSWSEVYNWFKTDVTTEGLPVRGPLTKRWDIIQVPAGKLSIGAGKDYQRTAEAEGRNFYDITKEKYGRFYDTKGGPFDDPFDIFTLRNDGTKGNPLYKMGDLKYIDPLTSMYRGMSRAINNMYMDDYKTMSIEHWIQEAKDWLNVKDKDLAQSPAYWFYNAVNEGIWKEITPAEIKNNLMTANHQIKQFLGIQDAATNWLHRMASKLSDSLYEKGFPKVSLVSNFILPKLSDPFRFVRSVVFHPKVGMFNPAQLFVQSQTYSTIFGVAGPKFASPGTKAAMFHMWSRINKNPEIIDHLDKLASEFKITPGSARWLRGQFKEAHDLLVHSGFDIVGGEHIFRDSTMFHDFLGSKGASFLDMSKFFFEEGERNVRAGAFYTAYLEIRSKIPHTGRLTAAQARDVLQRADLLAGNMSRASASAIQKGVWSIPTQFLSYQLRMMELVFGKRLTTTERIRLFGTYSIIYGIPGAYGISGIPLGDLIMKTAQDNGYVTGAKENSYLNSAVTEGIPALILSLITGNWYNISERYGIQGFQQVRDVLRSDRTFWDIVGGAALSSMSNTIASTDGFVQAMIDGITGEGNFKFKPEDAIEPFREIAVVNAGARLYAALQTGKWLSRKEGYLSDVSPLNAIFMSLTGLQPAETSDIIYQGWTRDLEKQTHKKALDHFVQEMHRAFSAQDAGDYQQAKDYQSRAWHWLRVSGYPEEKYNEAISIATKDWLPIIDRSKYDYYLKDVNEKRKPAAQEGFMKYLNTK